MEKKQAVSRRSLLAATGKVLPALAVLGVATASLVPARASDCLGSCEAGCKGTCEGGCKGNCEAGCTGTCEAGCKGSCEGTSKF